MAVAKELRVRGVCGTSEVAYVPLLTSLMLQLIVVLCVDLLVTAAVYSAASTVDQHNKALACPATTGYTHITAGSYLTCMCAVLFRTVLHRSSAGG
jgi:ABC-type uncharacterized transport system permease subunit